MPLMLVILLVAGEVCCNNTTGSVTQPDCEVRKHSKIIHLYLLKIRCFFPCRWRICSIMLTLLNYVSVKVAEALIVMKTKLERVNSETGKTMDSFHIL